MGNFSDIYGYETIKEHLQSAISMGKVSHAYVISGGLAFRKEAYCQHICTDTAV